MTSDEIFMRRTFELARLGAGRVSPNPRVGAVVVHDGKIIGEGWHQAYGQAHAEVNAINRVSDKSILRECDLFVNLEPCSHTGKTPPCTDLIIHHNLKRVVIANEDTNPIVAGSGISKLKEANIDVTAGVCASEGRYINRRFFTAMEKKRPYIILKWAQTADGFIAHEDFTSKWISNELSRRLVHKWRSEEDTVLVGFNTAAKDNPQLSVREWNGRNPTRIVLDWNLALSPSLNLFDGSQDTICYNFCKNEQKNKLRFVQLEKSNWLSQMLSDLAEKNIQSVIVEGGANTINHFVQAEVWDEARIFTAQHIFERGIKAPQITGDILDTTFLREDRLEIRCNTTRKS